MPFKETGMFTAEQIAKKLKMEVHTVRYRLGRLRQEGKVRAEQFGTTYVYPECVIKKVRKYNG